MANGKQALGWLGLLLVLDLLWIGLDQSVPAWDQADHLGRALHYAQAWRDPQWGSGEWWQAMWRLSPSYRAPLLYLLTVPVFAVFGPGWHQGMLVNTVVSLPLLGMLLRWLGGWGGWVLFVPFLLTMRTTYMLDYVLMVVVTGTWLGLGGWRQAQGLRGWGWAALVGVGLGLTVLTRPTGILFLLLPLLLCLGEMLWRRSWNKLGQALLAAGIGLLICGFWLQNNWLTILTSIDKAREWGERYQQTGIPAWWFYLGWLPHFVGWPLLLLGTMGWLLARPRGGDWVWVGTFLLGGYGICAVAPSYDPRFFLPVVPVLAGVLLLGVLRLGQRWCSIGWGLSLGMVLIQQFFGPGAPDYRGGWPHPQVIQTVIDHNPWQRTTIGVLPLTAEVNPFNVNFYGNLHQFQVHGRQLSLDPDLALPESQALDWYLTKTGSQGILTGIEEGHITLWQTIVRNPALERHRTWTLPDHSTLELWHRRDPRLTVTPLTTPPPGPIPTLVGVQVPHQAPLGQAIPVTYVWQGSPQVLGQGVVLLTWQGQGGQGWIQDHAIGFGNLFLANPEIPAVEVQERIGMGIPSQPGLYHLSAAYLDSLGQVIPLSVPASAQITITAEEAELGDAEVLDTASLFRQLAQPLRQGKLEQVFGEVARINQHDPSQSYYQPLEASLRYRLQRDPQNLELAYSLLLVQVLQQKAQAALATLAIITTLDQENPYAWLYQAVVHLYRWQGSLARQALERAAALDPGIPELESLKVVAAIQQLDLLGLLRKS